MNHNICNICNLQNLAEEHRVTQSTATNLQRQTTHHLNLNSDGSSYCQIMTVLQRPVFIKAQTVCHCGRSIAGIKLDTNFIQSVTFLIHVQLSYSLFLNMSLITFTNPLFLSHTQAWTQTLMCMNTHTHTHTIYSSHIHTHKMPIEYEVS